MPSKFVLTLQKRRINGPFERVTFIDPYPDTILKAPSFLITNILISLALLTFASAFVIGVFGATSEFSNALNNASIAAIGTFIYRQVGHVAQYFQTSRMEALVNGLAAMSLLMIALLVISNWLSRRLVVLNWKKRCETAPAHLLDAEIQEMHIVKGTEPEHRRLVTCYVLRIKVQFTHRGQTYEATPSVVNRISPGSIGVHFPTREGCEHLLATYQKALEIEFDPDTPLDCEIKGNLDELLRANRWPWLPIAIFAGALFLFSRLVIYILKQ